MCLPSFRCVFSRAFQRWSRICRNLLGLLANEFYAAVHDSQSSCKLTEKVFNVYILNNMYSYYPIIISQHEPPKDSQVFDRTGSVHGGGVLPDRKICKLGYTCKIAFSRVTKTKGLRDTISSDPFHMLDGMNDWGHATINLDKQHMKS